MENPNESPFESERLLVLEDSRPLRVIACPRVITNVSGVGAYGIHAIAGVGHGEKARLVQGYFPYDPEKTVSSQVRDAINTMTEMLAPFVTENTCCGTVDPAATESVPVPANQPENQPATEAAETAAAEAPKRRGRRSKAQIEADNAAAAEAGGSSESKSQAETPADPVKTGGFVPQVVKDPPPSQARGVTPPPAPPAPTVPVPATDADPEIPLLTKLETVIIPYGANQGKTLGSVPIKNLEWYAESLLAAYIKARGPLGVVTDDERAFIQAAKDLLAIKRGAQ